MNSLAAEVERGLHDVGGFDVEVERLTEGATLTLRLAGRPEYARILISVDGLCFSLGDDSVEFKVVLVDADEVPSLPAAAVKSAADWKAGRMRLERRWRMLGLCEETSAWWDGRPFGRHRRWRVSGNLLQRSSRGD